MDIINYDEFIIALFRGFFFSKENEVVQYATLLHLILPLALLGVIEAQFFSSRNSFCSDFFSNEQLNLHVLCTKF